MKLTTIINIQVMYSIKAIYTFGNSHQSSLIQLKSLNSIHFAY